MKTATITWESYNNYGTLLQAYALQHAIEQLGHENLIISDREILKEWNAKKAQEQPKFTNAGDGQGGITERLKRLLSNPGRLPRICMMRINRKRYESPYYNSQAACEKFRQNKLRVLYGQTKDKLPALNDQFDMFICGSDQIWSVQEGMFNPYYYLDFVTKKKISYAPSLGTDKISQKASNMIRKLLADYAAISVRESISAKQLSGLADKKVQWVVDPTLLHDRMFWEQLTFGIARRKKKYVLCYFLENREWYFNYAKTIAKKLHLEIILLPNRWDFLSSEYIVNAGVGPKEFVSLIRHSDYVLTDSYHGSIFSMIFERDFQYLLRFSIDDPNSQNIRIQSLFDYLNLNDRIVFNEMENKPALRIKDYSLITSKIDIQRKKSQKYLRDCFNQ